MSAKTKWGTPSPWWVVMIAIVTATGTTLIQGVLLYGESARWYGIMEERIDSNTDMITVNGDLICAQNTEDQIHDELFRDIMASLGRLEGALGTYTVTPGDLHEDLRKHFYRNAVLDTADDRPFGG